MKKVLQRRLLWLFAAVPLLIACDDKAPYYGEGIDSEFNNLYSSKGNKNHVTGDLNLTYNGYELTGKDVTFTLMTENTAKLKFFGILPGESQTVMENVAVTKTAGRYSFSGTYTSGGKTSFRYSGSVAAAADGANLPSMNLNLMDVTIPADSVVVGHKYETNATTTTQTTGPDYAPDHEQYDYRISPSTVFVWTVRTAGGKDEMLLDLRENPLVVTGFDLTSMAITALSNIFYLLVTDVEFHTDGNITATYSGLPDDLLGFIINSPTDSDRAEKKISPIGLVSYYVNGSNVYIRPELENIMALVARNRAAGGTRADGDENSGGLDLSQLFPLILNLLEVYPELNRWMEEGIKFNLVRNDPDKLVYNFYLETDTPSPMIYDYSYYFDGDYQLVIDYSEIEHILAVLVPVLNMLNIDLDISELLGMLGITDAGDLTIENLFARIASTTDVQLGIFLNN